MRPPIPVDRRPALTSAAAIDAFTRRWRRLRPRRAPSSSAAPRRALLAWLAAAVVAPAVALYDPTPDAALAAIQGEWQGSLTYRDYSEPKRMVTLPTRVYVALAAPSDVVLHYVFDDGPSKTVFSYETMAFDFVAHRVRWSTGPDAAASVCRITADTSTGASRTLVFERDDRGQTKRYTLTLAARAFTLAEDEVDAAGVASFRNRYAFARPGD